MWSAWQDCIASNEPLNLCGLFSARSGEGSLQCLLIVAWSVTSQTVVAWTPSSQTVVVWTSSSQTVVVWTPPSQTVVIWTPSSQTAVAWTPSQTAVAWTPSSQTVVVWTPSSKTVNNLNRESSKNKRMQYNKIGHLQGEEGTTGRLYV